MIVVDRNKEIVTVNGVQAELSKQQWRILEKFSKEEGLTIEKVAQRVYGSKSDTNVTTTSVTISRIKKIVSKYDFIVKGRGGEYFLHDNVIIIDKAEQEKPVESETNS